MKVPAHHSDRHVFHTTHLHNLKSILEHGFLSYNEQQSCGAQHHSIAAASIQERRAQMEVPCGPGGVVHDYVPLYFTKRSPMLLAQIQAKNVDQILLLHFAFSIAIVQRENVIFTSAAANSMTPPVWYENPSDLDKLNWGAIDRLQWSSPSDLDKRARMAEVLVHQRLDPKEAEYVVVWNERIRCRVKAIYEEVGVDLPPIRFVGDNPHGFVHFNRELPDDMLGHSIASGPQAIQYHLNSAVKKIHENPRSGTSPNFQSLGAMLQSLRADFASLPETFEIVGLESANDVHKHDVGTHTKNVVDEFLGSDDYRELSLEQRDMVELAAYLHDIGKGPKSRWNRCGGRQRVDADHPIKSVNMLVRILTEEVPPLDEQITRTLCKLVCYHDLVGDIIGRNRNRQQLVDVAESEADLAMLIAIGKADMFSVAAAWKSDANKAKIAELRLWALEELRKRGCQ